MADITGTLASAQALGLDRLDAQLLLMHALGIPPDQASARRTWLMAHGDMPVPQAAHTHYAELAAQRAGGVPLAYLTGEREFFGLSLNVDRRVLVPRPDTETLVAWALEVLAQPPAGDTPLSALDLGTGSGAIALALKHARPNLRVDAVDASADALVVASGNARRLGLEVALIHGSWLERVTRTYDCIVSNPPYVAAGDRHLPALVHEPQQALVSGPDGLDDLRHIVAQAPAFLRPGGWLLLEHGFDQAAAVRALLTAAGYCNTTTRHDLGGNERCTGARVPLSAPMPDRAPTRQP